VEATDAAIGLAVAVTTTDDKQDARLERSITAGGSITVEAVGLHDDSARALATATGAKDKDNDTSSKNVDQKASDSTKTATEQKQENPRAHAEAAAGSRGGPVRHRQTPKQTNTGGAKRGVRRQHQGPVPGGPRKAGGLPQGQSDGGRRRYGSTDTVDDDFTIWASRSDERRRSRSSWSITALPIPRSGSSGSASSS
jgi:hypothetical protein